MKRENKEINGAFYFLEEARDFMEVEKYIEDNICEGGKKYYIKENKMQKTGNDAIAINLGKYKFAVYPVKCPGIRERVIMLKTKKEISYETSNSHGTLTNNLSADFKSNHCFVILHSVEKRFNFIFEQLLDDILEKLEVYKNF